MLEHVGGDQAVEAAEAPLEVVAGGQLLDVGLDHPVEPAGGVGGIGGVELHAGDLGALARLQRGAQRAGRAADVEDAPGAAAGTSACTSGRGFS